MFLAHRVLVRLLVGFQQCLDLAITINLPLALLLLRPEDRFQELVLVHVFVSLLHRQEQRVQLRTHLGRQLLDVLDHRARLLATLALD